MYMHGSYWIDFSSQRLDKVLHSKAKELLQTQAAWSKKLEASEQKGQIK